MMVKCQDSFDGLNPAETTNNGLSVDTDDICKHYDLSSEIMLRVTVRKGVKLEGIGGSSPLVGLFRGADPGGHGSWRVNQGREPPRQPQYAPYPGCQATE